MANQPVSTNPGEDHAGASLSPPPLHEPSARSPVSQPIRATVIAEPARPAADPLLAAVPQEPLRWREILAVLLVVVLADLTIYRGQGFAGCAVLFSAAPLLLALGSPRPNRHATVWLVAGMLLLLAAKLAWCGHAGLVAAGFMLVVAVAMTLAGRTPYVLDIAAYAAQTPIAGCLGLEHYAKSARKLDRGGVPRGGWLSVLLPLITIAAFGSLFLLANPDLVTSFTTAVRQAIDSLREWLRQFAPRWSEFFFWVAAAWLTIGLLRPVLRRSVLAGLSRENGMAGAPIQLPAESPLYAAFRNTLVAVIVLFAFYLVFEFKTLWFKVFPKGFYYAGYAHEGAAWLTAALALSTAVLSSVFRGSVLGDPRLPRIRRLAWIWSAENVILALAVYHRMHIYVDFNGMTRMRTVGLFGITAVMVGFLLVVWKIAHGRDFVWLLRRHLWTLAIALYLLAITSVDPLVHSYNVRRVLAGDLAPVVQISVHPISSEGVLVLPPLVESRDEIIREGICAMLAQRAEQLEARRRQNQGWTAFQLADQLLLERLHAMRSDWQPYTDPAKRAAALAEFHQYAYQWY